MSQLPSSGLFAEMAPEPENMSVDILPELSCRTYKKDPTEPLFCHLSNGQIFPPPATLDTIRKAQNLALRDDDIIVCTYPKCGTTWMQHICSQLVNPDYKPAAGKELYHFSPFIEIRPTAADELPSRRVLKSHMSYNDVPKSTTAVKYIHVVRNPKDCIVSYYNHLLNGSVFFQYDGTFDHFFDLFVAGKLEYNSYFDHLNSYLREMENNPNIIVFQYEKMLQDFPAELARLAKCLGGRAEEIFVNEDRFQAIVKNSSFASMKEKQECWFPESMFQNKFIRKGKARDWKNYFTQEQSNTIDQMFKQKLKGTIAEHWWIEEMSWD